MFQTRRPAGRIFYLVLAVMIGATGIRLHAAPQSGPALTSVIDTVYRADGSEAQGTLVITWPAFVAASGAAVAAGSFNVTLGSNGALNVALATNAGATPAGVYYTVVYQLQPSEVRTEYWVVPTSSPATLAQVRTTPGSGTAAQPVSTQFVNSALAGKANDNAVVHLAGTETVTGTKSFSTPPNVPMPVGTGDVTNKGYVDTAIATVGAGNYLPTAGGAMTGPLTLSASPTAPLQAAPKQYVDLTAASKADLVSGLVPTSELGSGTASSLNCLLGNGAWGSCGSSANATEIQSVPVGSTSPANGQVLTYSSSSGQYAPATPSGGAGGVSVSPSVSQNVVQPGGTALTANNFNNITYSSSSYNWSQNPSGTILVGSNTITLSPCPIGLTVNSPPGAQTFVYISGVGAPEAVLITSTTCLQAGGASGTITFTAANTHSAGYTVGSASQGVQEAINAASFPPNYASGTAALGSVVISPAQYTWQARVTVSAPDMVLDFSGSVITCTMADTCLFIGSNAHSTYVWDVTVKHFVGQAACNNCNYPMIEDQAQKTHLIDIGSANPFPVGSVSGGSSFGSLIQVDNDQAAIIDGLSTYQARWYHCTSAFCSVAVKGAGGSGNAGVLYIKNSNISLSCGANGVDNQDANTLRISDSVIQGQAQFAVRSSGVYSNVPNVELDNVYGEVAGCAGSNPLGLGEAGLIVEGGFASVKNSVGPVGSAPVFANTGSTQYNYYVVAHSSTNGASAPFLAGIALTNQTGSISVVWPQFGTTGTITYDVIRTSGQVNNPAPYTAICTGGTTTGCGSVATGLTVGSACAAVGSSNVCSFTDTASTSTTSYSVTSPANYWPALPFWNGSVIYTTPGDVVSSGPTPGGVYFDRFGDNVANSAVMQCRIAYTYVAHISLAEVRTALPSANYVTQLVGALSDGAACEITSDPSLDFYPQYVPALNQLIVASYRGSGRAVAQVQNSASVASLQNGADDGTRGSVRVAKTPEARTDVDCENAALAILDDAVGIAWSGSYETWCDFLPGAAEDIFPGDAIVVNVPSRGASFTAIVREIEIQIADPAGDRGFYTIGFANDLATPLGIEFGSGATVIALQDMPPLLETTQVGAYYQTDLTEAQITAVTSTTVQVDAGMTPGSGFGIEVRQNDYGWGQANDRNLLGRFSTQTFNLTRLAKTQDYFLRLYDSSSPPKYSRYSAALHVDYPL